MEEEYESTGKENERKTRIQHHQPRASTICCALLLIFFQICSEANWNYYRRNSLSPCLIKNPKNYVKLSVKLGCNILNSKLVVDIFVESNQLSTNPPLTQKRAIEEAIVNGRFEKRGLRSSSDICIPEAQTLSTPREQGKPVPSPARIRRRLGCSCLVAAARVPLHRGRWLASLSNRLPLDEGRDSDVAHGRPTGTGSFTSEKNTAEGDGRSSTRQGGREKVSGMKRWELNIVDDLYIYICTYRTGLHARISKILAKIRSSIRRVCMLWQVLDRVMTRRFFFFFVRSEEVIRRVCAYVCHYRFHGSAREITYTCMRYKWKQVVSCNVIGNASERQCARRGCVLNPVLIVARFRLNRKKIPSNIQYIFSFNSRFLQKCLLLSPRSRKNKK